MRKQSYLSPITESTRMEIESHIVAPSTWSVSGSDGTEGPKIPIVEGGDEDPTGAKQFNFAGDWEEEYN